MPKFESGEPPPESGSNEPWTAKLLREGLLAVAAGKGISQAAEQLNNGHNLSETASQLAVSSVISLAMTRYMPAKGYSGLLTRSAGTGMSLAFIADIGSNGEKVVTAITEAWNSDQNFSRNLSVANENLGKFAFDSALFTAGGLASIRLGSAFSRPTATMPLRGVETNLSPNSLHLVADLPSPAALELAILQKRLVGYSAKEETFFVPRPDGKGPFIDHADFIERGVNKVTSPIREYTVAGLHTKFIVPEEYAHSLDQVRNLRLEAEQPGLLNYWSRKNAVNQLKIHPFGSRALPEDFISVVEHAPDGAAVKRLLILPWEYQYGALYGLYPVTSNRTAASAGNIGDLRFHNIDEPYLANSGSTMGHEWSHLIKWQNKPASEAFDTAAKLEGKKYVLHEHALKNNDENWAVHLGDGILNPNAETFLASVENAPIRSAVLGRTLAEILSKVPAHQRSPIHAEYENRAKHIQRQILPSVMEDLERRIRAVDQGSKTAQTVRDYLVK
ncbi:hypothetical protein KBF38_19665 [bacterium]|nr:hypothetical protein [bacterium]